MRAYHCFYKTKMRCVANFADVVMKNCKLHQVNAV